LTGTPGTRPSLLVRLRAPRDERAWVEFLEIYEPLIYRLARKQGLQAADADDLTQEVFRAVAGAIDRWDPDPGRGSFRSWLFRIARNLIVNLLAARSRRTAGYGAGGSDLVELLESQPAPSAEDTALFDGEYRRRMFTWAADRVRGHFRETTWQAFWRTGVEGQETAVVARSLGISPGAVHIARSRVMARLRQEIEQIEAAD
jgi:RNA polymerase sigma factor (sigma-70 family)